MTKFREITASATSRRRARLLWGVSVATLIAAAAAEDARAQSVGALMAATHQVTVLTTAATAPAATSPGPGTSAAMAAASARALRYQTQLNSAQDLAHQAQMAAQAAARALNQNLVANNFVATIADGLTSNCNPGQSACGLTPAVAQITPASADATGVATWQGAGLPTASASNPNQVTVNQTAQRAVLSWTTFNVGQNTTLTFNQKENAGWVALNRVVGGIDPATGLRNPQVAPSQILGSIKAAGTVLVLDQNGILFGPTSQVNVGSLIATPLEIGRAANASTIQGVSTPLSIAQRNSDFLNFGILGYSQQTPVGPDGTTLYATFSAQESPAGATSPGLSASSVQVKRGAALTSAGGGYLLLIAPTVVNAGQLTSSDGEVALQSGNDALLTASTGTTSSADPSVRGLVVTSASGGGASTPSGSVENAAYGIIDAPRSYVSLGGGTVKDYGAIFSTTSISENGYVNIFGQTITIAQDPGDAHAPAPVIAIGPDSSTATLPQDPISLQNFKPSIVRVGRYTFSNPGVSSIAQTNLATGPADIVVGSGSLIYAPGGAIAVGGDPNPANVIPGAAGSLTVQGGATIDAAGLTDVLVPASRNAIRISPVKGNELANSPTFRNSFLNGATVFLDPRLSGVTSNGVAWVGSPLIAAAAYAQQVGAPVTELMVKGGAITLGVQPAASTGSPSPANAATFNIQKGAVIDISGGWKTYQAGSVQQSYLVDAAGQVIPISQANLNDTYVALYNGYVVNQPRWGLSRAYMDPLLTGAHYEGQYSEGQDAGSLTLTGPVVGFDAALYAGAFAGPEQILGARSGTSTGAVNGDIRPLQAAPSQLPAGGYLDVNAATGGGDIGIAGVSYVVGGYAPQMSASTTLSADALSGSGLSQLTVQTSGKIDVAADASLSLSPGGAFVAVADRTITVEGSITAPSGVINLTTVGGASAGQTGQGSVLASEPNQVGAYDVVINGQLNVAGRWVNDFNAAAGQLAGPSYLGGGSIAVKTAANLTTPDSVTPSLSDDISGSIVINPGARLNLSGGGYVSPTGGFSLTAKGGNLSLLDPTSPATNPNSVFAINYLGTSYGVTTPYLTSRVSIADGSILDAGFGGGGVFSLTAPYFSFAASSVIPGGCGQNGTVCGAALPLDFFSKTGFANYNIVSFGTKFILSNLFDSGAGRYSQVLETQIAEVKSGQTLPLSQTYFSPLLSTGQMTALQGLGTGGNLYSVLTPAIPTDAWDQKPVNLSVGGLIEFRVDSGGQVLGAAGSSLTVGELYNQGLIRIPGGTITQSETNFHSIGAIGVSDLSQVFGPPLADGTYSETATNTFGATGGQGRLLINPEVAVNSFNTPVYFLGDLPVGVAVDLAAGSVTDLSGQAIVNPRAVANGNLPQAGFTDGVVLSGGSFIADGVPQFVPKGLVAEAGATINLSGAQATFDRPTIPAGSSGPSYAPTQVWSNGGNLTLNQGGVIAGAAINAQGGAALALGGVLNVTNAALYAPGATPPAFNAAVESTPLSVADIAGAAFSTFVSQNTLTSVGDVTLSLPRAVFVQGAPPTATLGGGAITIGSGGHLEIDAPYIGLDSAAQTVITVSSGLIGSNSVTLKANAIDVTGGVLLDQSIGQATLSATGDIRLVGVAPSTPGNTSTTLIGQLVANGDVTLAAAQVYPTTGSSFTLETTGISSPAASNGGTIAFRSVGATPATPYSAGGSLNVAAMNIDQGGVLRVPLGQLNLGSNTGVVDGNGRTIVPATQTLTLEAGSVTSVSADGLNIPYGTTTDQVEWFFSPTQSAALTAPPAGVLHLAGGSIAALSGATVNLKGGGDVYAFEFVAGKGGTRDVLDQFNPDQFSSTNGYQYPDKRQIYAIVPGLSSAPVAAMDPIYSSGYSSLYSPSQAGLSVYLNAAPGVTAGWYTLLPAKYALLPGGMRVVQDTGATMPPPANGAVLPDGTIVTSGYFGVAGVNTRGATPLVFDVQSQATVLNESKIAQTQGNPYFAALAAHNGVPTPQLPIDAGRLILSPLASLGLDASFQTTPVTLAATTTTAALVGRGSEVDLGGDFSLSIDSASNPVTPPAGSISITDASLAHLGAASLFIGGVRTDNADGTTSLAVSAQNITVQSGVTLTAPEIILAVDGPGSMLTVSNGASLIATGAVTGESHSPYVIDGLAPDPANPGQFVRIQTGKAALLRVSNGPERLLTRLDVRAGGATGTINVGAPLLSGAPTVLQGAAVEANTPGIFNLDTSVQIAATAVALGAKTITFDSQGSGLLLTPQLQASLGQSASVTLQSQSAITFAPGTYGFNALTLDTPGLRVSGDGAVAVNSSGVLSISDSRAATTSCVAAGTCGAGSLTLSAGSIAFGSGAVQTYGAGTSVTLNAAHGLFADGATTLDVGPAALTINAPYIGDRGAGAAGKTQPSLSLATTGAMVIASATPASAFSAPAGTPGSTLTISGSSVSVSGTELRATAGTLKILSTSGVAISGGALLATPSYAGTFGDAADPTTVSAPGGLLALTAQAGDISISDDSVLAVGGANGQAGALSLTAHGGSVYAYHGATSNVVSLASTFSAAAPGGGASLTLDTGGAFDLSAFAAGAGRQFNGALAVRSGAGDLTLAAGDTLTAASVSLTADGGQLLDSGAINTSGAKGGDVSLYGAAGVHLTSTAVIDAHASGHGPASTLQASGGNVTLGVDYAGATTIDPTSGAVVGAQSGAITIDSGAVINVAALNTGARLVNLNRVGATDYTYVAGDVGGTVTFRAPVITQGGTETVNVSVNGSVGGASGVVLDAFKRFDLAAMAANPTFEGVTVSGNTATLDLGITGGGLINPLADLNGPVVRFVQTFAASVALPASLSSLANLHARPGVELDYKGDITLNSNWNLGAGAVNVQAAAAAGLLAPDQGLPGRYYVVGADGQTLAANEGQILANYTTAYYRVGGSFYNEPGVLSLRAGRNLTLNGSITDGFFQFADQTDPNYLNQLFGGGDPVYQASVDPTCVGGCAAVPTFTPTGTATSFVSIRLTGAFSANPDANGNVLATFLTPNAPYSDAANSPAALGGAAGTGALVSGNGDPLGSAQLFPLLPTASGGTTAVGSWSYQLVAGADLGASSALTPSVNPLTVSGAAADLIVQGQHVYGYKSIEGTPSYAGSLNLYDAANSLQASQWYQAFVNDPNNAGVVANSYTTINFAGATPAAKTDIRSLAVTFFSNFPTTDYKITPGGRIDTTLYDASLFMIYLSDHFSQIASDFRTPPATNLAAPAAYATAPTLVRTGTGSITLVASGSINLLNGDVANNEAAVTLTRNGRLKDARNKDIQLGGAAIYTAGALANPGMTTATDVATGAAYTFSLGGAGPVVNNLTTPYQYGFKGNDFTGILISNPIQAQGGGNVTLIAGDDVLGRRDAFQESRLSGFGTLPGSAALPTWVGTGDQPWRTGAIGAAVNLLVDPVLFGEGVGTLGGGDIAIHAGGAVSDLSIVATDSARTVNVGGLVGGVQPQALVKLGGGDVSVTAVGDILGGRLDVASGNATLRAFGNVASAGGLNEVDGNGPVRIDNTLQVRLSDGQVNIEAGRAANVKSITALGVNSLDSGINSKGFYAAGAGVSILAGGGVTITNDNGETGQTPTNTVSFQANVYPGSFEAVSFTGDLSFEPPNSGPRTVLLYPDPTGTLTLLAAGDIAPAVIAQLDSDPTLLPGAFSIYRVDTTLNITTGLEFAFPGVLPNTTDVSLRALHNPQATHAGDLAPNRIAAGGAITDVTLSTAKQTRVAAGEDIVNMVFLGQNLAPGDVTRITAGRDITSTTALDPPLSTTQLPTVQGNTFVLGGPGALFIEAGRDAGPFLNSAVSGGLTYGGGIIAVGNQWNPWLPTQSADVYTAFGVAGGENFAGLISTYLVPGNFSNLPGYEFLQTTNAAGLPVADRTRQVYALSLVDWMTSIASDVINRYDTAAGVTSPPANAPPLIQFLQSLKNGGSTTVAQALAYLPQLSDQTLPLIPWMQLHAQSSLTAAYGSLDVTYAQALTAFQSLPALTQREFLIKNVYFNELVQTSIPTSPSYLKYSRGYTAVNTLFPSSYGYTANNLSGGLAGATATVKTGNLDLRLATIQTDQGGNIAILGPGGQVLAGSVVATSAQASRRDYIGSGLYQGLPQGQANQNNALPISAIPAGYEGILTLRGGAIDSFTDVDFLLNQSRAFTEQGGDVALWSSNADVNAGQGPRTTADVAPAVVHIDENAYGQVFTNAAVSGAGIGAFAPDSNGLAPDVFLMAPRGTVDAGDAGVRSAGNVFIAAFQVANADAIQAQGTISGAGGPAAVNVSAQSSGDAASAAAAQAAQAASSSQNEAIQRPLIIVDVLGFLPDESTLCTEDDKRKGKCE